MKVMKDNLVVELIRTYVKGTFLFVRCLAVQGSKCKYIFVKASTITVVFHIKNKSLFVTCDPNVLGVSFLQIGSQFIN